MKHSSEFSFDLTGLIKLLLKWRKHFIIIFILAVLFSSIFSSPFFIKPLYKSEAVFYPTTINSISNAMFTDLNKRESDVLAFGEEEEAENALQILNSSHLLSRVVRNYNLMNHYDIDPNGSYPRTKLEKKIESNISFRRTRYLSIEITVWDKDPLKAAEIANGIMLIYDTVKTEIHQQVAVEALSIVEQEYQAKKDEVWGYKQELRKMADKGVINYEEQSRAVSEEIYKLKAKGNDQRLLKQLQEQYDQLANYAGDFTYFYETLILENEELVLLKKRYKKAKVDVDKTLTHKFVVTEAAPAEKKSYPIRWLIVFGTLVLSMILTYVIILFIESQRRAKVLNATS